MDVNMTHLTMVITYLERMLEKNPKDSLFVTLAIEMLTNYRKSIENNNCSYHTEPTNNNESFSSIDTAISYYKQMAELLEECKKMRSDSSYISDYALKDLLEYLSNSMGEGFYNYQHVSNLIKDHFKK